MRLTPAKAIDLRWAGLYALVLGAVSVLYLWLVVAPTQQGWAFWWEFLVFEVGRVLWLGNTWFALLFYVCARGPRLLRQACMLACAGVGAWNAARHYAFYYPQFGRLLPASWGFDVCTAAAAGVAGAAGTGCDVWADLHVNLMTTLWAWDALFVFGVVSVWIAVDATASPAHGGRLHWSLPRVAAWIAAVCVCGVDTVLPLWLEVLIAAEDAQARDAAIASAAPSAPIAATPASDSDAAAAAAADVATAAESHATLLHRGSTLAVPTTASASVIAAPARAAVSSAASSSGVRFDDLMALLYLGLALIGVCLWIPGLYEWSVTRHTIAGQLTDGLVTVSGSRATLVVIGTWASLCVYFLRDVRWAAFDGSCDRVLARAGAMAFGLSPAPSPFPSPAPSPSGSPRAVAAKKTLSFATATTTTTGATAAASDKQVGGGAGASRPLRWCVDWSLRLLFLYGLLLHVGAATALALCYRQLTPHHTFARPVVVVASAATAATACTAAAAAAAAAAARAAAATAAPAAAAPAPASAPIAMS